MALTIRLTPEQEAVLKKIQKLHGIKTLSGALIFGAENYLIQKERSEFLTKNLDKKERDLYKCRNAVSNFQNAFEDILKLKI